MALSTAIVWEVNPGGNDANGGGFHAGASGTDKTYGVSAVAVTRADLVVDAATNTIVTSAGTPFAASDVGNILNIATGTGWTAGFYEILSVDGSNKATLDRSPAAVGTTGGTGTVGGAFATVGAAFAAMAGGNTAYIKKGTYNRTAALPTPPAGAFGKYTNIIGYNATRGDLDALPALWTDDPVIQLTAGTTVTLLTISNGFTRVRNLVFDCGNLSGSTGVAISNNTSSLRRVLARNYATIGIAVSATGTTIRLCGATLGKVGATAGIRFSGAGNTAYDCVAWANACPGFLASFARGIAVRCISLGNTGASSDGFQANGGACGWFMAHCISHGNGRDGLRMVGGGAGDQTQVYDSVFTGNAGYGINADAGPYGDFSADFNAFFGNATAAVFGVPPGPHDIILTASPYVDSDPTSTLNLAINATAGGGASIRGAAHPFAYPGLATTSYQDIGAVQHQDSGGGSSGGGPTIAPAGYKGDFLPNQVVRLEFATVGADGAPASLAAGSVILSRNGTDVTPSAGVTLTASAGGIVGRNVLAIDTSADPATFTAGSDFHARLAGTSNVAGVSMVGRPIGGFSLAARSVAVDALGTVTLATNQSFDNAGQTTPMPADVVRANGAPIKMSDGTAQGGSTTTIILAASAPTTNDIYKYRKIAIVGGAGVGQESVIQSYNGTTKTATVDPPWAVAPDGTSLYQFGGSAPAVLATDQPFYAPAKASDVSGNNLVIATGTVQASPAPTPTTFAISGLNLASTPASGAWANPNQPQRAYRPGTAEYRNISLHIVAGTGGSAVHSLTISQPFASTPVAGEQIDII